MVTVLKKDHGIDESDDLGEEERTQFFLECARAGLTGGAAGAVTWGDMRQRRAPVAGGGSGLPGVVVAMPL